MNERSKFGLIGKDISYSFSKKYFTDKFKNDGLKFKYFNFDIPEIEEFPFIIYQKKHEFIGLNVTIPYKQKILKYLDQISVEAKEIGAVNTIKFTEFDELIGYNTDVYGFEKSLVPLLKNHHKKALILGTGGASKAVQYVLQRLNIEFVLVSRNPKENQITYSQISEEILKEFCLLINCTPLGTSPNIDLCPPIPFEYINKKHILYDLIYNPSVSKFLFEGQKRGATIKNGLEMLELQAEKSWEIWNS